MASEVSIAGAQQDLPRRVAELERELNEAHQREAATAEVLKVISGSKFELLPVLDTIARTAGRLCAAEDVTILLREHADLRIAAHHGAIESSRVNHKYPLGRGLVSGRAVVDRQPIHVSDVTVTGDEFPVAREAADKFGFRTSLGMPLLHEDEAVGCILLRRKVVRPFDEKQIALLRTFADQAVIAIQNTRLFEAEQASKRELTEALEQQTATADVLKVISRSALDLQRVLDALVESAARLCEANDALIFQAFGDGLRLVAHHGQIPTPGPVGQHTLPLERGRIPARAVIDRRTIHVADILAEGDEYPDARTNALQLGFRTALAVPMVHAGEAIGAILIRRAEIRPFTPSQIELVNTFADQAVIAIENTRLFEEVQARTSELQESLKYQTATSEVLAVISRSPSELQPVLDAIVGTARTLCQAERSIMWRLEDKEFCPIAFSGVEPSDLARVRGQRMPTGHRSVVGRAIEARRAVQVHDVQADEDFGAIASYQMRGGLRTVLAVPLLREGQPIGGISLARTVVVPFADKQVALVETFADQAIIAIENTRLFEAEQASKRKLQVSLEHQTATSEVLGVISRSPTEVQPVFDMIAQSAARVCNARHCNVFRFDGQYIHFAASHGLSAEAQQMMRRRSPIPAGRGSAAGRAIADNAVVEIHDILTDQVYQQADIAKVGDYRSAIAVPMRKDGQPIGAIALTRQETGSFPQSQIDLLKTFADQAVIAIENARLFNEIAQKSRELEIASQHKSQFVANMSHELRTPLAAILGYAELMQEGFYEAQGPKSIDALTRIRSNGKHLLGLINTVLDIAKIESGQFTLSLAEYAMESVVETVLSATESLAQNKNLILKAEVAKPLPVGLGDEQRLTQVLLNLVGNAIKFTDMGEVRVTAKTVNGQFAVSVSDTGPGIPVEHQTRIFEQFHQVDSSNTKAKGGTGLGLSIAKQIVDMHGGRIWVESTLGKGSIFQMELPTRAQFRKSTP